MRKIRDLIKGIKDGITSKWVMLGFVVFLIALLVAFVRFVLSDSAAEWFGYLLGTQSNKIKTIQFIRWAMSGVSVTIGIAVLIWWWAKFQVKHNGVWEEYKQGGFETAGRYMRKTAGVIKGIINGITGKLIVFIFAVSLIVLFVILVLVIFSSDVKEWAGELLDIRPDKIEIIQFIGLAMSGASVVIWLVASSRRAEAQVENNRLAEKKYAQECFKTATKHLGDKSASVRIAAFYEFFHLTQDKDNGEEYRKSALGLLYAYARTATIDFSNGKNVKKTKKKHVKKAKKKNEPIKISEEIQELLNVLFKFHDIDRSGIRPNLERVYFFGADLSKANLSEANLSKANLSKSDLSGADLSKIYSSKVNLSEADLSGADLSEADLSEADLSGADLFEADLSEANLSEADLSGADLSGADLSKANLPGANLSGANLPGADLSGADLSGANLPGADLSGADLSGADLRKTDLRKADLPGANLSEVDLRKADLSGADLRKTDLSEAKLSGADLSGADLSEADLSGVNLCGVNLSGVDLSGADLHKADLRNPYPRKGYWRKIYWRKVYWRKVYSSKGYSLKRYSSKGYSNKGYSRKGYWRKIYWRKPILLKQGTGGFGEGFKIQLGSAFYTNETRFPEWFVPPIAPPDNGDKVQFPEGFIMPEKSDDGE